MPSWITRAGWQSTEPVDRFKTLLDQTMTISVAGPPGSSADAADTVVSIVEPGDAIGELGHNGDRMSAEGRAVETRWGLPDVMLTDPVALGAMTRLVLSGLCAFAMLSALGAVIALAAGGTHGTAPYVVLGVIGGLAGLAMLVFVMGLRTVTISSGSHAQFDTER